MKKIGTGEVEQFNAESDNVFKSVTYDMPEVADSGDVDAFNSLVGDIANQIASTQFVEGARVETKGQIIKLAEINRGGISIGRFFTEPLSLDEILAYLREKEATARSWDGYYSAIVPVVLSCPIDGLPRSDADIIESPLLQNLLAFQTWFKKQILTNNWSELVTVLHTFKADGLNKLSRIVATSTLTPQEISEVSERAKSAPGNQNVRAHIAALSALAMEKVFNQDPTLIPFQRYSESRTLRTENPQALPLLESTGQIFRSMYEEHYDNALRLVGKAGSIEFQQGDSLYLKRLGIGKLVLNKLITQSGPMAQAHVWTEDGIRLEFSYYRPEDMPDNWVEEMIGSYNMTEQKVYEVGLLLQAVMIDLARLDTAARRSKDKQFRALGKSLSSKGKRKPVVSVDQVANHLMAGYGFDNALRVYHFTNEDPDTDTECESAGSRLVQIETPSVDAVDPLTGEVHALTEWYWRAKSGKYEVSRDQANAPVDAFLIRSLDPELHSERLTELLSERSTLATLDLVTFENL